MFPRSLPHPLPADLLRLFQSACVRLLRHPFFHPFWLPLRVRMFQFRLSAETEISLSQFVDFTLILILLQGKYGRMKPAV
jgi:hypothetical protein